MKIFASASPGELRAAAWDGSLVDYAVSRPGGDAVGDLHRGRIIARVPAMAGCFVALDGAEAFLPDSEGAAGEGTILGVRVTRAAQGGKGPRVSGRLSAEDRAVADAALVGGGPPALLRRGPDALARLRLLFPNAAVAVGFDDDIEGAVAGLGETEASLPGGARMSVHPTPALVAIDVDLAAAAAMRGTKSAVHTAANAALIPALCRQIRLRQLGGAIVVDLAGLGVRKRVSLAPDFVRALAEDRLAPRFLGFSALGLAEILRPRVHAPLHELLAGPHAAGLAALRALSAEIAAVPHHPPVLRASASVAQALRADPVALAEFAHLAGRALVLKPDRTLPTCDWTLEAARA